MTSPGPSIRAIDGPWSLSGRRLRQRQRQRCRMHDDDDDFRLAHASSIRFMFDLRSSSFILTLSFIADLYLYLDAYR